MYVQQGKHGIATEQRRISIILTFLILFVWAQTELAVYDIA